MLDLNYVRENLESVRAALEKRSMPVTSLDDFTKADAERRRLIGESDQLNAERNAASREIGALMKDGQLSTTAKNIKVITANGQVTLRGPVKTAQEKAKIDQLAKSAAGGAKINNELDVKY